MTPTEVQNLASVIVTAGAVAFAVAVLLWAYRLTEGARTAHAKWRARAAGLEAKVERGDSILAAHPGVVLVWEDDAAADPEAGVWGAPRLYGSPAALAAMLKFADASDGPEPAARILDGIADYEARSASGVETTLRAALEELRARGSAFSLTIIGPSARFLEVDGRPAGRRLVLWLADATVKGLDESAARGRFEEDRWAFGEDPTAFTDMLGKAPLPVWRLSSGLKLQWANAAYLKAVEAETLAAAVEADVALDGAMREQARRTLQIGQRTDETRPVVAAGSRRFFEISMFPVSGGVAGVARDVTQAVEAREELERNVRAQNEALHHLDDAVVIFAANQKLDYANRAFVEMFQLDPAWVDSRPAHGAVLDTLREKRLMPAQRDYPAWRAAELARYTRLDMETPEEVWRRPDGRILRVARLRHPHGGLLMVFSDITDQLSVKRQFNTLIKVQQATLDKLQEGVAVFGSDGRLKLFNTAFQSMWRLPDATLTEGQSFDVILEACVPLFHDRSEWRSIKARITDLSPEARQAVTGEMRRFDESILVYRTRPLPDGATVIAFQDVTAEREVARALAAKDQALEEAEKLKTDFIEHVSYQLRAPLTSIVGFAELLQATVGADLADYERGQLGAIVEAGEELSKLVDDIIDIAALDAQKLELDLQDLDVSGVLHGVFNLVQPRASEAGLKVRIDCPEDVGAVHGDARRIKQIVYNLALNAIKHTPASGEIVLGARSDGVAVRLWVEDDGAGIPTDAMGHVFERFAAGPRGGAGLGLALVRELVDMHGGWVDLESEINRGTRVTVHLRAAVRDDLAPPGGGAPLEPTPAPTTRH